MKLYISDLDGTLLNNQMCLSDETISILNKLIGEGLNFSFATARSIDSVEKIIKPLNLNLPYIIYNGVAVYDPVNKNYLRKNVLSKKLTHEILSDVEDLSPFVFIADELEGNHIYFRELLNKGQFNFVNSPINKGDKRFKTLDNYLSLDFDEYKSSYVEIPMSQHIGRPSQPIVSAGEQVKKGQLIAVIPENSLGAAIHASIDGVVVKVDEKSIAIKVGDYE